jgi:hypothetical protein
MEDEASCLSDTTLLYLPAELSFTTLLKLTVLRDVLSARLVGHVWLEPASKTVRSLVAAQCFLPGKSWSSFPCATRLLVRPGLVDYGDSVIERLVQLAQDLPERLEGLCVEAPVGYFGMHLGMQLFAAHLLQRPCASRIKRLHLGSPLTPLGAKMLLEGLTSAQEVDVSICVDRARSAPPAENDVVLDHFPPGLLELALEITCEAKHVSVNLSRLAACKELQHLSLRPGWPDLLVNTASLVNCRSLRSFTLRPPQRCTQRWRIPPSSALFKLHEDVLTAVAQLPLLQELRLPLAGLGTSRQCWHQLAAMSCLQRLQLRELAITSTQHVARSLTWLQVENLVAEPALEVLVADAEQAAAAAAEAAAAGAAAEVVPGAAEAAGAGAAAAGDATPGHTGASAAAAPPAAAPAAAAPVPPAQAPPAAEDAAEEEDAAMAQALAALALAPSNHLVQGLQPQQLRCLLASLHQDISAQMADLRADLDAAEARRPRQEHFHTPGLLQQLLPALQQLHLLWGHEFIPGGAAARHLANHAQLQELRVQCSNSDDTGELYCWDAWALGSVPHLRRLQAGPTCRPDLVLQSASDCAELQEVELTMTHDPEGVLEPTLVVHALLGAAYRHCLVSLSLLLARLRLPELVPAFCEEHLVALLVSGALPQLRRLRLDMRLGQCPVAGVHDVELWQEVAADAEARWLAEDGVLAREAHSPLDAEERVQRGRELLGPALIGEGDSEGVLSGGEGPGTMQLVQRMAAVRRRNAAELSAAVVLGGGRLVRALNVDGADVEGLLSPYCTPVVGQVGRCEVRCRLWPPHLGFDLPSDDGSSD